VSSVCLGGRASPSDSGSSPHQAVPGSDATAQHRSGPRVRWLDPAGGQVDPVARCV